ncbi:hypothetical protein JCM10135_13700 [Stetteria hydrogenophila]
MPGGVVVVHAVEGGIVESVVEDRGLYDAVREYARLAMEKWDVRRSDFLVLRDRRRLSPDEVDVRSVAGMEGVEVGRDGYVYVTVFLVSYDNSFIEGEGGRVEDYVDRAVYIIAPNVGEDFRDFLEVEAAEITAPRSPPKGVREA